MNERKTPVNDMKGLDGAPEASEPLIIATTVGGATLRVASPLAGIARPVDSSAGAEKRGSAAAGTKASREAFERAGPLGPSGPTSPPESNRPLRNELRSRRARRRAVRSAGEWILEKFLFLNGAAAIILIGLIFLFLFREGFHALQHIPLSSFWGSAETDWDGNATYVKMWQPNGDNPKYSLLPLFCGSFLVALPAVLIAGLIGLATGIYLAEIAGPRTRDLIKPVIELLAGIPTIVIGFFCLVTLATLLQNVLHTKFRLNAVVGAIGVSFVIIPVIASLVDDALRAVPGYLREAAYGMGATRWEMVSKVVLPASVSGVTAALILGMGRALGETMIVLLATGNAAQVTANPFDSVRTMTATIAAELGAVPQGGDWYESLFLVGSLLFGVTFILNLIAEMIVGRMRRKLVLWASQRRHLKNRLATLTLGAIAFAILLIVLAILGDIFWKGKGLLTWEFLTQEPLEGMSKGGIFPAIFGTVCIVILMIGMALPLGVFAAIYMVEYAGKGRIATVIRAAVNNLAGVPSIVFGLFGLGFFILFIGRGIDKATGNDLLFGQPAMLWASATLAILTLPVIIVSTAEALNSVPASFREAAFALGATRWQVVRRVVLPQAWSGILTGSILSVSRGAGETAPILFTGCAYYLPRLPVTHLTVPLLGVQIPVINPLDQFMELSYHIFIMATQSHDAALTRPIQYGTTLVLVGLTFTLNLGAILLRMKLSRHEVR